jgi:hypothetical protein
MHLAGDVDVTSEAPLCQNGVSDAFPSKVPDGFTEPIDHVNGAFSDNTTASNGHPRLVKPNTLFQQYFQAFREVQDYK